MYISGEFIHPIFIEDGAESGTLPFIRICLRGKSCAKISYLPTLSLPIIHKAKKLERVDFSEQTKANEQFYIKSEIGKHILSHLWHM